MGVSGQLHHPFTPGTYRLGDRVGPRAGLDAVVKRKIPSPCRNSKFGRPAPILVTVLTELSGPSGLCGSGVIAVPYTIMVYVSLFWSQNEE
jgi:hypothetical protein